MRNFELNKIDGLALFCDNVMIDYVAWGINGDGPIGYLPDTAVFAGMWASTDYFVETGSVDLGAGYFSPGVQNGDSLARDGNSTDTNGPNDWIMPGGYYARSPTPSVQNFKHFALPLINEVLFLPAPGSRDFT